MKRQRRDKEDKNESFLSFTLRCQGTKIAVTVPKEIHSKISLFSFTGLLLLTPTALCARTTDGAASIDVEEGDTVRLECRFPTARPGAATLYWIRTNRNGHDNVAIKEEVYEGKYR